VSSFTKDPDARLDYAIDWTPFLGTDTIDTAEWLDPTPETDPPLVVEDEGLDGNVHVAFVSGGQVNRAYRVTSRATTTEGRIQDESITITITETSEAPWFTRLPAPPSFAWRRTHWLA